MTKKGPGGGGEIRECEIKNGKAAKDSVMASDWVW